MKYTGKITEWNAERGFGFIQPDAGGDRTFVHISALQTRSHPPSVGASVAYSLGKDKRGRPQAQAVSFANQTSFSAQQKQALPRAFIGVVALIVVAIAFATGQLAPKFAATYAGLSLLSFLMYMKDKHAARNAMWRTPEHTLHFLDLFGGWPGGLIAQQKFRHKTAKRSFQFIFWLSVLGNLVGILWLTDHASVEQLLRPFLG